MMKSSHRGIGPGEMANPNNLKDAPLDSTALAATTSSRGVTTSTTSSSSAPSSSSKLQRPSPLVRRRLSKGLIAAEGNRSNSTGSVGSTDSSRSDSDGNVGNSPSPPPPSIGSPIGASSPSHQSHHPSHKQLDNSSPITPSHPNQGSHANQGNQDSNSNSPTTSRSLRSLNSLQSLPKPCYSARLALSMVQNALVMGTRTKYSLCPQGKARKNLVARVKRSKEVRDRRGSKNDGMAGMASVSSMAGAMGTPAWNRWRENHERAEDDFLRNPSRFDDPDKSEEYSSADEDDYDASIEEEDPSSSSLPPSLNRTSSSKSIQNNMELRNKEPLFVPTTTDAASIGLQGQVPGMSGGRLPFNYRKLRYFDLVTANDRAVAREFLKGEIENAKEMRRKALSQHLKMVQNVERQRIQKEGRSSLGSDLDGDAGAGETLDLKSEQTALATAITRFPQEVTPIMSAALLMESLAMNPQESIEGMAKCYDGIVSAGTALLDIMNDKSHDTNTSTSSSRSNKPKLTTTEIMNALSPLLTTTLEQPSGDLLLSLSKLRTYCGTRRYQRRFTQRIAPLLVRPPTAAMWCLRHQTDMEPIVAAVEMILDNASEVFSSGWFERGRMLLEDKQRVEMVRDAASQLRRLNEPSPSEGLLVGLSSLGSGHRRGGSWGSFGLGRKEGGGTGNESLEEWEVVAVDSQIRQSVLDVFLRDWSRISTLNLSPKDGDTPFGSRLKRGISAKSKQAMEWQNETSLGVNANAAAQASNFNAGGILSKSPRTINKIPLSPRAVSTLPGAAGNSSQLPSADALESTFGPSFSSQVVLDEEGNEGPSSPTNYSLSTAPTSPRRDNVSKPSPKTPPHDRRHDDKSNLDSEATPLSPHARTTQPDTSNRINLAPLSPQSTNYSTTPSLTQRSPSNSSSSSSNLRDQYRALTSTPSERKRTVAACRALRAQISQFEEAFIQMHGRAPKGAAERAPLASTYMQYREWKRAIRADAAGRIQALVRGARVRRALMMGGDVRLARLAGRHVANYKGHSAYSTSDMEGTQDNYLKHLSIPLDIGGANDSIIQSSILEQDSRGGMAARPGSRGGEDGVEVVMRPGVASVSSTAPSNINRQPQRPSSNVAPPSTTTYTSHTTHHNTSPRTTHATRSPKSSLPDVTLMSLAELQQRKRELKQQLKLYDMNFHKQHGRMPEKREKEPIRHLYESYNAYKNQIAVIEKGEVEPGPGTGVFAQGNVGAGGVGGVGNVGGVGVGAVGAVGAVGPPVDTNMAGSPKFNPGNMSPQQSHYKNLNSHFNMEDHSEEDVPASHAAHAAHSSHSSHSTHSSHSAQPSSGPTSTPASASASGVTNQDLAALKAEKATLHQMLRSYEKDFFKQHKRQVSSFADIRPVASQYRRYKEIKKAIASLQDK